MPWLRWEAEGSEGRLRRWMVLADKRRLVTGSATRRSPYIALSAFMMPEISLAQNVQVSRG